MCEFCNSFDKELEVKTINMYELTKLNGEKCFTLDIERPLGFIPEKWRNKALEINYCPICGRKLN